MLEFTATAAPTGDINDDGGVDLEDYALLALRWLGTGCNAANGWCGGADFEHDGDVDWMDLKVIADNWLVGIPVGDINSDGAVDFKDYAMLALRWLGTGCNTANGWCGGTDFEPDGDVDWNDLKVLTDNWLEGK